MKPKYSLEELRDMARTVKAAGEQGDQRYLQFVMQLSLKVGTSPTKVMDMIDALAKK